MRDLLVKELSINPERSDPYFVLGQLYRELPGLALVFRQYRRRGLPGTKGR